MGDIVGNESRSKTDTIASRLIFSHRIRTRTRTQRSGTRTRRLLSAVLAFSLLSLLSLLPSSQCPASTLPRAGGATTEGYPTVSHSPHLFRWGEALTDRGNLIGEGLK